jgi:hypothetical protein
VRYPQVAEDKEEDLLPTFMHDSVSPGDVSRYLGDFHGPKIEERVKISIPMIRRWSNRKTDETFEETRKL